MRTEALLLAALSLLGLASAVYCAVPHPVPHKPADKDFLILLKKALQLLWHPGQPSPHHELRTIANSYQLDKSIGDFKDPEVVKRFIKYYRLGYLPELGEQFSVYDKNGPLQAELLVDLLYNAKDFETFYCVAAWAREYLSAGLFVYSFTVSWFLRKGPFVLPALYDITPQLYVHHSVIREAWRATLEGKTFNKKQPYVIRVNYSSCYTPREDILLAYYTQDVSLLANRNMYRYRSPFWARLADYNRSKYTRRGDRFYYLVKSILARYYLERLSNHLPDIEPIDYEDHVCGVRSYSALIVNISTTERRLWDAVDSGYVYDCEKGKYSLRDPLSSDIFGRIVEGNEDSINKAYYGSLYYRLLAYTQQVIDSCEKYTVGSFFRDSPESVFRSPLFYRVLKRVVLIMDRFKELLGPYSRKELLLPGVEVKSLSVDKMVTYMEDFDFELNNAVPVANIDKGRNLMVIARQRRLNHKPFSYKVLVHSDKDIHAVVSFWIGPQYDVYGRELSINEKRHYMVYTDAFVCKLQKGRNELVRYSKDFDRSVKVPLSYSNLTLLTEAALAGKVHPFIDDFVRNTEIRDHTTSPRGFRSGMALSTYVIVTEYKPKEHTWINPAPEERTFYPFDRPVNCEREFDVPNAQFCGTTVYHWDTDVVVAA